MCMNFLKSRFFDRVPLCLATIWFMLSMAEKVETNGHLVGLEVSLANLSADVYAFPFISLLHHFLGHCEHRVSQGKTALFLHGS